MKINNYNNCKYVTDKEREELLSSVNIIPFSTFDILSIIIVKKDDNYYIIKDMWKDTFLSDEENVNNVLKHNFMIISKLLFKRSILGNKHLFLYGDNIIIGFD